MTAAQITKRQAVENTKYETAKRIVELLDEAVKAAGLKGDDAETYRQEILELVTED